MTPKDVMAEEEEEEEELKKLASSYIGLSFSLFLAFLPKNALPLVQKLESQRKELSAKLFQAEEQLRQMKSRRQEDSKANARVVEIFASHRNSWQAEEKRLLHKIDARTEEIAHLRARVEEFEKYEFESKARIEELEMDVGEKDEIINFMSRTSRDEEDEGLRACQNRDFGGVVLTANMNVENVEVMHDQSQQYQQQRHLGNGFDLGFLASASKFWAERDTVWQVFFHFSPFSLSFSENTSEKYSIW